MFSKEQFQKRISGIVNEMETIEKKVPVLQVKKIKDLTSS